ncbi:hypothetical protein Agub_g10290, partial [Astrephomene gubernaculifera]
DLAAAAALSPVFGLASAVVGCILFGVTYRYAVRGDSSNKHLRMGVVAAFGLVRASGAADMLQAAAAAAGGSGFAGGGEGGVLALATAVVAPAGLYALESLLLFGFASVALEAAFAQGFVKRFDGQT